MKYSIIEISGYQEKRIALLGLDENGVNYSIPLDESNSDYLAWLETEEGKAYLASQKASK